MQAEDTFVFSGGLQDLPHSEPFCRQQTKALAVPGLHLAWHIAEGVSIIVGEKVIGLLRVKFQGGRRVVPTCRVGHKKKSRERQVSPKLDNLNSAVVLEFFHYTPRQLQLEHTTD